MDWVLSGDYKDILYHKWDGIAKITINRPQVRNAFRPLTVNEMSHALEDARNDPSIGVIILTGQGKEAFCSGGDQKIRGDAGYADDLGVHRLNVLDSQIVRQTRNRNLVGKRRKRMGNCDSVTARAERNRPRRRRGLRA